MKIFSLVVLFLLTTSVTAQNCELSDVANHYWHRGRAAEDAAKTPADYKYAIDEYIKAFAHAPACPDIAYDLALCYEYWGTVDNSLWKKAIEYYEKYLELKPDAFNRELVKGRIEKLKYAMENKD